MPSQRPWRILFIIYMALLIASTHWPQFAMGNEEHPPPDKLIHFLAFATAPVLLALTGWLPLVWVLVLSLFFAIADEVTQHFFAVGRIYNPLDMIASMLGVIVASIWIYAFQPMGQDPRGICTAKTLYKLNHLSWQPRFWRTVGMTSALGFLFIAVTVWVILWFGFGISSMEIAVLLGMLFASWAGYLRVMNLVRNTSTPMCCYKCGTNCDTTHFDDQGHASCTSCGTSLHAAQWDDLELPSGPLRRAVPVAFMRASLLTLVLAVLAIACIWGFAQAYEHQLGRNFPWRRVIVALDLVSALSVICFLVGLTILMARIQVARHLTEQQHKRCVTCGHCLALVTTEQGRGHCPECRTVFMVLKPRASEQTARS